MEAIEEISKKAEIMAGSAQEVQKQTEELNTRGQQIDGMAKDQGPRRKTAEEALAALLEKSKAIISLINEANKGIRTIGDEMRTIVERTADMDG
jgi:methyl-accepting chemotaxis protein